MSNDLVTSNTTRQDGIIQEYVCHKIVKAAKIEKVKFSYAGQVPAEAILFHKDGMITVDKKYIDKHEITENSVGGYYVQYKDGYESYSPAIAFEEGYTLNVESPKTLHNSDVSGAKINVSDLVIFGDGDTFKLICKASSKREGWMKSTKAMEIEGIGCVIQVTTQQYNEVAEALVFVPGVRIDTIYNDKNEVIERKIMPL